MLYTLEQGPVEQGIIAMAVRQGRPIPKKIMEAPQLFMGLELFFVAFLALTDERQVAWGEGAIPWRAMREWCDANEISEDTRADVFYFVKQLDGAYLRRSAEKRKAAGKGG